MNLSMTHLASPPAGTLLRLRLQSRLRRTVKRLYRPVWMARLREANLNSQSAATDPNGPGPTVALTSHGARLSEVFYTLESIAAGSLKPSRLTLWIDHRLYHGGLPTSLQRLQARGVEVLPCTDTGPHTKYLPMVMSANGCDRPLVTADDDQLYPTDWLARLHQAWQSEPDLIHCYRAHEITLTSQGELEPYRQWPGCTSRQASHLHFATGVSGVIYPVAMLKALRAANTEFSTCCPRADDIWLNVVALRQGIKVRQLGWLPRSFYEIPGTRAQGLANSNVAGGGNDVQLQQTYSPADLHQLVQAR